MSLLKLFASRITKYGLLLMLNVTLYMNKEQMHSHGGSVVVVGGGVVVVVDVVDGVGDVGG